MNAIRSVFSAFSNLAASINGLASVVDLAAGRLRQQLALDEAVPALPELEQRGEVLEHAAESNGTGNGKRRRVS